MKISLIGPAVSREMGQKLPICQGLRVKRAFFLLAVAVAVATIGTTMALWHFSFPARHDSIATAPAGTTPYPAPQVEIRGFSFTHTVDGQTVFHISADAFRIQHKKLGHFRFGLVQEAVLANARIELHLVKAPLPQGTETPARSRYTLVEGLDQHILAGFSKGRIAGLMAEPVDLVLLDEDGQTLSRITGRRATVRFQKKDMLLEGKIHIRAGGRRLAAERAILRPETGTIAVQGPYTMEDESRRTRGRRLVVDLALKPEERMSSAPTGR